MKEAKGNLIEGINNHVDEADFIDSFMPLKQSFCPNLSSELRGKICAWIRSSLKDKEQKMGVKEQGWRDGKFLFPGQVPPFV